MLAVCTNVHRQLKYCKLYAAQKDCYMPALPKQLWLAPRIDWYVLGRLNPNDYFDFWIGLIASAVLF